MGHYVNPAATPDYLKTDFTETTPMHRLLAEAPLTEASYSIEACQPTVLQAKHLDIKPSEACLAMTRRIAKSGFQGCGPYDSGVNCY